MKFQKIQLLKKIFKFHMSFSNQVKLPVELSSAILIAFELSHLPPMAFPGGLLETCKDAVVRQTNLHMTTRFLHQSQCRGIYKTCQRTERFSTAVGNSHPWPSCPSDTHHLSEKLHHFNAKLLQKQAQILLMRKMNQMNYSRISP